MLWYTLENKQLKQLINNVLWADTLLYQCRLHPRHLLVPRARNSGGRHRAFRPIHVISEADESCPYIGSAMFTTKDIETGEQNVTLIRLQVKGPQKTGMCIQPKRHTDICMRKYCAAGKNMPVSVVIGHLTPYLIYKHY
ncbi:UbiD family decarboxylase domain-containing protein [Chloroflexota bacterium]